MPTQNKIEISYRNLFKIVYVAGIIWLLTQILEVLVILFISIILTSAIKPLIKQLDKYKIPKNLATILIVFGFVSIISVVLYLGVNPLVTELTYFVVHFGEFIDNISRNYNIQIPNRDEIVNIFKNYFGNIGGQFGNAYGQIFSIGSGFFNLMISTLALIALTFYQLAEENKTRNFVASFFGENESKVRHIIDRSEEKLGSWFRGQLSLMAFIGVLTYILLSILGFAEPGIAKFVLPLAVIAGILEIVPVLGPTLALIPAVIVGASVSPFYAIIIFAMYLGIQQVEANIVIPKVMNKAVGLDPILVLLAIMIGNSVLGAMGSLLSVPIMAVISVLYEETKNI